MLISNIENYVLPQGWSKCCLPDFTDIVMGQSPTSDTYNKSGNGIPFFQGKAEFGAIYPTVAKYCSAPNKIALAGATLLSVRAPVGPTNLAKEKCCIGRGLAAIHPVGGVSPLFVLYLLRSIETDLSKEGTGSTFSAINKQFVEELAFGLPPLPEQHRIVAKIEELFSELDKGVENLKTARAQLKVYRQALLKHAFEGKLTAQWRTENQDKLEPAEALLKRIQQERAERYQQQLADWKNPPRSPFYKGGRQPAPQISFPLKKKELEEVDDSPLCKRGARGDFKPKAPKPLPPLTAEELAELPELPEGWGWVKVGNVDSVGTGITPLKGRSDFYANGNIPWVTSGALNDNLVTEASDYVTNLALKETNLRIYPKHTLLIALYGEGKTRGKCSELLIEATTNQAIAAIVQEGVSEKLRKYMKWFFQKNYGDIRLKSSGGVQPNLNLNIIENTLFPMCCIEEATHVVNAIESKLSEVDQLDQTITTSLQQAEALRQSILKKAFSGQLVPQDPHDEPASTLLERIKAERAKSPSVPLLQRGKTVGTATLPTVPSLKKKHSP